MKNKTIAAATATTKSKAIAKYKEKKETAKKKFSELLSSTIDKFNFTDFILCLRSGQIFDTQERIKSREKQYYMIPLAFEKAYAIFVTRAENSIVHQRVFEALMEFGKITENEQFLEIENLYKIKKFAGLNTKKDDTIVLAIIKDIARIFIEIQKVSENGKLTAFLQFNLLGDVEGIIENDTKKAKGVKIELNKNFIKAVKKLPKVKIDSEILEYIHKNVKSPHSERIIKYFLTQSTKSKFEKANMWSLIKKICDIPIKIKENGEIIYRLDEMSDRYHRKILAKIEEDLEILKKFGINFDRKEQIISFDPAESQYKNIVKISYQAIE